MLPGIGLVVVAGVLGEAAPDCSSAWP